VGEVLHGSLLQLLLEHCDFLNIDISRLRRGGIFKYEWVYKWKNCENRLTFKEVMGKSLVSCFFETQCNIILYYIVVSSVFWRCWLGGRKGHPVYKNISGGVLVWLSVWSEVQTCIRPSWCHCYSLSLASVKSRLVLPFWYRLTRVVPEKGLLNGCVRIVVVLYCYNVVR